MHPKVHRHTFGNDYEVEHMCNVEWHEAFRLAKPVVWHEAYSLLQFPSGIATTFYLQLEFRGRMNAVYDTAKQDSLCEQGAVLPIASCMCFCTLSRA